MNRYRFAILFGVFQIAGCGEQPAPVTAIPLVSDATPLAPIPAMKPVDIPIREDVTCLTKPLDTEGRLDYLEALNDEASNGVTPETNFEAHLRRIVGLIDLDPPSIDAYFDRLQIPANERNGRFDPEGWGVNQDFKSREHVLRQPWTSHESPAIATWLTKNQQTIDKIAKATLLERCYIPAVTTNTANEAKDTASRNTILEPSESEHALERWVTSIFQRKIANRPVLTPPLSRSHFRDTARTYRSVFHAFQVRFNLALGEGRLQHAQLDLLAMHRLSRLLTHGPELLYLCGASMEQNCLELDIKLLESKSIDAATCQLHLESLRDMIPVQSLQRTIQYQRLTVLDAVYDCVHHRTELLTGLQLADTEESSRFLEAFASLDWVTTMQKVNEQYDTILQRVASGELPTKTELTGTNSRKSNEQRNAKLKLALSETDLSKRRQQFESWYFDRIMALSTPSGVLTSDWLRRTIENIVMTCYSAKLYGLRTGAYPTLSNQISGDSPINHIDVMNGSPLKMRLRPDGGLMIYSVGANLFDDQGIQGQINSATTTRLSGSDPDLAVELEPL